MIFSTERRRWWQFWKPRHNLVLRNIRIDGEAEIKGGIILPKQGTVIAGTQAPTFTIKDVSFDDR
jgi:hypothetical protein